MMDQLIRELMRETIITLLERDLFADRDELLRLLSRYLGGKVTVEYEDPKQTQANVATAQDLKKSDEMGWKSGNMIIAVSKPQKGMEKEELLKRIATLRGEFYKELSALLGQVTMSMDELYREVNTGGENHDS